MKIIRDGHTLSAEQHREIAGHFDAVQYHAAAILDITRDAVLVWATDAVLAHLNGMWCRKVSSALDDAFCRDFRSEATPYYGGIEAACRNPLSGDR